MIAAFHEDKVWCGTQFGLSDYNPDAFYLSGGASNCLINSLEIPTSGWPGPGEGISIAATDVPYEGNYIPVYGFSGYTYYASQGAYTPFLIEITEHPEAGFIGFGNCEAPVEVWPAEGGAIGFFMAGIPVYPEIPGACCEVDGACEVMLEADCLSGVSIRWTDLGWDQDSVPLIFAEFLPVAHPPGSHDTPDSILSACFSCIIAGEFINQWMLIVLFTGRSIPSMTAML